MLFEVGWHNITAQRQVEMRPSALSRKLTCGLLLMDEGTTPENDKNQT